MPICFQCDFRRWSWVWESFEQYSISDLRELCGCNLLAQDCVRWLHDPVCQNFNHRSCARDNFYTIHDILITFPMTVVVQFLRNCVIITRLFFVGISTKRVKWCEQDSLPSFVAFMSTRNQYNLKDRLNAEKDNLCEKNFPNLRNSNILHQPKVTWHSTRVSLNCSKVSQGFFGILTILESCLAASVMDKSKPVLFWEISCSTFCERFQQYWPSRVPMKWSVRLSFILIVMTHHSWSHSGDLYWQRAPPYEELGRITFHFLPVVGMVLCVKRTLGWEECCECPHKSPCC